MLCKVLRLFANTFTVDYKYSLLSRDSLTQPIQMHLSKKQNNFTNFFYIFNIFYMYFRNYGLQKTCLHKRLETPASEDPLPTNMVNSAKHGKRCQHGKRCRSYGLQNTWLHKCLKSSTSEDFSSSNMVNGPKHCLNLHNSTFLIFIDQCAGYLVGKSLP